VRGIVQLAIAMAIMAYVSVIKWDAKHALTYRNPVDWTNIGDHIAGKCLARVFKAEDSNG
jgi:hypothetical protein